jgi:hypothetical protein
VPTSGLEWRATQVPLGIRLTVQRAFKRRILSARRSGRTHVHQTMSLAGFPDVRSRVRRPAIKTAWPVPLENGLRVKHLYPRGDGSPLNFPSGTSLPFVVASAESRCTGRGGVTMRCDFAGTATG